MIEPRHVTTRVGLNVEFLCKSVETVTWLHNSGPLPPNAQEYRLFTEGKFFLRIKNVQANNLGYYECQGELKHKFYFYAEAYLGVSCEYWGLVALYFFLSCFPFHMSMI